MTCSASSRTALRFSSGKLPRKNLAVFCTKCSIYQQFETLFHSKPILSKKLSHLAMHRKPLRSRRQSLAWLAFWTEYSKLSKMWASWSTQSEPRWSKSSRNNWEMLIKRREKKRMPNKSIEWRSLALIWKCSVTVLEICENRLRRHTLISHRMLWKKFLC